jgi:hypothetical protein
MRIIQVNPDYGTVRMSRRKIPLLPCRGEFGMTSFLKVCLASELAFQLQL